MNWGLWRFNKHHIYNGNSLFKPFSKIHNKIHSIDNASTFKNRTDLSKISCTPYINHANLSIKYLKNIKHVLKNMRLKLSKYMIL